jgi:PAS domain S-box-containing protein
MMPGVATAQPPAWGAVFACARVGIALADLDGRFIASNRAYQEIAGYSAEELAGMTLMDLTHEDDREVTRGVRTQLLEGGRPDVRVDKRYRRKDGATVWVRVTGSVIPGPDGAPEMFMAVVEDITERKQAEDEVRLSEAFMADAQRLSRTGSWALNPFTGTLFWSRETYHICGFDPADGTPTYRMVMDRIPPGESERVDAQVRRAIHERLDYEGEHRFLRPDGVMIHIRYLGRPVIGARGELVRCVGTIADITARKRVEERMMQVQDEERRRIARQLHETTAQDLAALKMNLAALVRHGAIVGDKDRALLEESATLAARAMEDIRVLSYHLHPPLLDDVGLASALRWYVQGFGQRSGIDVRLAVAEDFDRLPQDFETALFRCVQESLINVHRHARSATAEVRVLRAENRVVVEIQDRGRGMPRESGVAAGDRVHLGVGIAGMRERVQQLGGTLEITSGSGGTTVRAILPLPLEAA